MKKLKKISSACCVMVLAAALLFQNTATYCSAAVNSSAGSSTEIPEGYTPIYTIADLAGINSDTSGNYILMNDIDMTEETSPGGSWDTGHGWTPLNTFSGVFDGNGHRIIGMHIYGEFENSAGLFSRINLCYNQDNGNLYYNDSAIIKNLGILNCEINVKSSSIYDKANIGGIVGYNGGIIQNCYVTGEIKGYSTNIGGIAGCNYGVVTDCYNASNISGLDEDDSSPFYTSGYTGGITAAHYGDYYGEITNCYNAGKISSSFDEYLGPICGYKFDYYKLNKNNYSIFFKNDENNFSDGFLTDAQMKYPASFTGFDFNDTWIIDELSSYPYPQLKSCPQVKVNSLELKTMPSKLIYSQGDELDLSGAVLSITYEDGVVTSTEADKSMVSGIDMDIVGKQTVVIRYLNGVCSFDITVNEVKAEEITLPKAEYSVNRNDKLQLDAIIKPDNTGDKSVVWETDNDVVATVTQNGVVSGINAGTATITATTANGLAASCIVTVKVPASSIKLNVRKLTLKKGKKKTLKAKLNPLETTDTVKWTSSSPKVVSVTQNGVIKAKKKGYAVIMTKTTSGKYASVEVTVKK